MALVMASFSMSFSTVVAALVTSPTGSSLAASRPLAAARASSVAILRSSEILISLLRLPTQER